MYFLVTEVVSREVKIIPSKWIKNLLVVKLLNYGITYEKNKIYTAFYSRFLSIEPDFHLNRIRRFDDTRDACYDVRLLRCFGKFQ